MAHHKSAIKRIRTSLKQRAYNRENRSRMRAAIKAVLKSENKEQALENLKTAYSLLDQMVKKNIIHKNKAANQKSRLSRFVNSMS
ncbi:MAG TPA: 30S ribosomal protein S20 [Caldithrix abyssi]|uniref:Small ribosomal subunit protein bS20 n=1 Tax=Caldithrix abyssi TaxID=187145 RepID=A0A7V5RNU6_CALAY|nr:30S ribosomal protein S20 [Caldithrix abyssi]